MVTLEHDSCGRVTRRIVTRKGFRPQTWTFAWNAQDQMIAADGPNGRWHYGYDPFGRRIFKESNRQREDFLWDSDVLARSGTIDWFFEPDSFRPMARMDAGMLFHIVNDHLGTPKEMFSEGGDLAWSVDHDTWGTARRVSGAKRTTGRGDYWVENVTYSVSEAAEPAAMLCPIRFQGQWEDAESGLYYNRFRYYEPLAGQYASPDPIGIEGGFRPQQIFISPSAFLDPLGLASGNFCCYGTVFDLLIGPYGDNGGHHLNQGAAYAHGNKSAYKDMLTATLPGNVFTELGSPHFRSHQSMEAFWDLYRDGGPNFPNRPTNLDYDRALRNSLTAAGLQPAQAHVLADMARSERIAAGFLDNEKVPRIPGQINSVRKGSNCK